MQFNHVTLLISDFERSKAFYAALGLIQIVDAPPRYARFAFPDGDATLSIEVTPEGTLRTETRTQLFFECGGLYDDVAGLKAPGLRLDQDPTDMPYLWRESILHDPDGHEIRLYRAGEN